MKLKEYSSFQIEGKALKVGILCPETVPEYDSLAGKDGAALDSAVDNIVYRGGSCLPSVRYYFCDMFEEAVKKEFPIQPNPEPTDASITAYNDLVGQLLRKTKNLGPKKRGVKAGEEAEDRIVFAEGEAEYIRRALPILAELRGIAAVEVDEFQLLMDRVLMLTEEIEDPDNAGAKKTVLVVRFDPTAREPSERGPKTLPKMYLKTGEAIVADGQGDGFIEHFALGINIPEDADQAKINQLKAEAIGWKIKALEDAERAKTDLKGKYANFGAAAPASIPAA